ncbi:hypothetical protein PQX77_006450 [Marasmius sp. AFHP31]|nr:hypothetical protein PQX77_006450 [Marasmius sp. AFHP31]
MKVPLDYDNPDKESAAIAIVRLPANVSSDSEEHLGPILINPGGPGGSGVDSVVGKAEQYRSILGPQFDIVGFDPRGVQRSTPRAVFYETFVERLQTHHGSTELNHSAETPESFWAYNQIMGNLALQRGKEYLPHMNTDHSARDMLKIVEAYGQEKLQFWGFSYGSVLGYTFASMFPDKVGRVAIDGIVDPEDYYRMKWMTGIKDIENTRKWFLTSCKEAGPESCAFYEDSVEAMESKLNGIYTSLIKAPMPVEMPVETNVSSGLVTYGAVRYKMLRSLYSPFLDWRKLAVGLAGLAEGNATAFYSLDAGPMFECDCDPTLNDLAPTTEALNVYTCNDGDAVPSDVESAKAHYQESTEFSPFGSIWASFRIACAGWSPELRKDYFRGVFWFDFVEYDKATKQLFPGPIGATNTSFPLLVIGNVADPVTSIDGAKNTTQLFPGSVLLTQDSPGHCSTKAPSVCTAQAIRAYFANGTLPEEGTVCPMDGSPFDDPETASANSKRELGSEEDQIYKALHQLARAPDNLSLLV